MFKLQLPRPIVVALFSFLITASAYSNTLTGADAIQHLKRDGAYDSLSAALQKSSGRKDTVEGTLPTAVGLTQKVIASDAAAGKFFGYSVAISGSTAVIGSPFENGGRGSAYIFSRVGTSWVETQKIVASDAAPSNLFGYRVAMHGGTIVVTALQRAVGPVGSQGSAYVFTRVGGTWTEQQILTEGGGGGIDNFGLGLAIHGDTIVVGAPFFGEDNRGGVWVFTRTGGVWSQQAFLNQSDVGSDDAFGASAAINGDTLVVGAYFKTVGGNFGQGAAYVFTRKGTSWSQQQKLTAPDGAMLDNFGVSVGIGTGGNTVLIGANSDDIGGNPDQGSAYIFTRFGSSWSQQQKLFDPNGGAEDFFGLSVAMDQDLAIVGALYDSNGTIAYSGSATVYRRWGDEWAAQPKLTPPDNFSNGQFGFSVAISGQFMMVGTPVPPGNNIGAAYFARVLGPSWSQEARRPAADGSAQDLLGYSMAISGDTVVAGAPLDTVSGISGAGSAYVFIRSGSSWNQQAKLVANDPAADTMFGCAVSISGDTAAIGACRHDGQRGAVYVFVRSGGAWTQQQKLMASDAAAMDLLGTSVSVNGNTLVAGAPGDESSRGAAYVFTRAGTVWTEQQKLTASDAAVNNVFGNALSVDDNSIAVGASGGGLGDTNRGAAYIFTRSGSVWSQQQKLTSAGPSGAAFGVAIAIKGETVLIGACDDSLSGPATGEGSAYVFTRAAGVWTEQQKLTALDAAPFDSFGSSVALYGDVAVIGTPHDTVSHAAQGSAYVYVRSRDTWTQQQKIVATDPRADDLFGTGVGVDGDKVVVGTPNADLGARSQNAPEALNQGAAYFFLNSFSPTSSEVSLSGRVTTSGDRPISNATLTLTGDDNSVKVIQTGSLGHYNFTGVVAGRSYVLTVSARRFTFADAVRLISANADAADMNFVAQE